MYLEHFQLKEFPYQLTPDSDFLYLSKAHSRAKAYMDYAIWNRDGFVVITGEVGTGKTTLIQKFISDLDKNVLMAKIFQTQLTEEQFLQAVLNEFELRPLHTGKVELLDMLNNFLLENFRQSRQVVLIVDEAQNLSLSVLEEIRLLSGLETRKEKLLHIILVGQPELKEKIESPELSQLLQRVRLRFHLRGLSEVETREYILHRLRVAGARRLSIFADNAIPIIYQYTGGIPRLINTLCDTALTCAYADELRTVTTAVIKVAIDELQWQPFSRRAKAASLKRWVGQADNPELTRLMRENRQLLAEIGNRLEKLESLFPLTGKIISIEAQLRRIADTIGRREYE